jgi:hypothetical protein
MVKPWLALQDTGRFHADAVSDGWFQSLKQHMPRLDDHTRMSTQDYRQWLERYRIQHSTSAIFRYLEWRATWSRERLP